MRSLLHLKANTLDQVVNFGLASVEWLALRWQIIAGGLLKAKFIETSEDTVCVDPSRIVEFK
jgi:hypothetical protein